MSKLTKRKALEVCIELHIWQSKQNAKGGDFTKRDDWPKWKTDYKECRGEFNCPLCTLVGRNSHGDVNCEKCPLFRFWGSDEYMPCTDSQAYLNAYLGKNKATRSCAHITIANAAKAKLAKLPPLKGRGK